MRVNLATIKASAPPAHPAVARLLGVAAPVMRTETIAVNELVHIEVLEIDATELRFEEHGRFLFLPVEGSVANADKEGVCKAELQLHYLRHGAEGGSAVLTSIAFHPQFLAHWPADVLASTVAFRRDASTEHQLNFCSQAETLLDELSAGSVDASFSALLRRSEIAAQLLRRALDAVAAPFAACAVPACRFLAYESEREKIFLARDILEKSSERPLTIKELSRKVAMNECYLKKGFKALTGKTIYDFQHERRIARAQRMLGEEGRSVSDVADELGFSSISHFSTAFKKATGLKPCELLK